MRKSGKNTRAYFINRKNVDLKILSASSVRPAQGKAWEGWMPQVHGAPSWTRAQAPYCSSLASPTCGDANWSELVDITFLNAKGGV